MKRHLYFIARPFAIGLCYALLICNSASAKQIPQTTTTSTGSGQKTSDSLGTAENHEDGMENSIIFRLREEKDKIKDPKTNTVPIQRLISARIIKNQIAATNARSNSFFVTHVISKINWVERGPNNIGGRTRAVAFDLNDKVNGYKKVFAGGVDGGLWYTNDITVNPVQWHSLESFFEPNIAISCITQNPINPLEWYVGTGEGWFNSDSVKGLGVWKSSDGGKTWSHLETTSNFSYINSVLVDKLGNVYIAGLNIGVRKSSNGGVSWQQVIGPGTSNCGADLQLAANGDIYASLGAIEKYGAIFISDYSVNKLKTGDKGTWKVITPNYDGKITPMDIDWYRIKLACSPSNPNLVYAMFEESREDENYDSYLTSFQLFDKSRMSWSVKNIPPDCRPRCPFGNGQAWYSMALAVDPNNSNIITCGSLDAVKSIDAGAHWQVISQWYKKEYRSLSDAQYLHADHHAYVFPPNSSSRMLVGTDGGIFYTENADAAPGKAVFKNKNNGFNITQFYSVALHKTMKDYILAGAQDNGTQRFSNAGLDSTVEITGGDGGMTFIDQNDSDIQLTSYTNNNYAVSLDNGKTFIDRQFNKDGGFINPVDYDSNSQTLYGGSTKGHFFRWSNVPALNLDPITASVAVPQFADAGITCVTISPLTKNKVYFGLDNGKIAVVDSAENGTQKNCTILAPNPDTIAQVSCIAIDPKSENHMLVSYSSYGVRKIFETNNALATSPEWIPISERFPDTPVRWIMFYPGTSTMAIIATDMGVWTADVLNGALTTWVPNNSLIQNVRVDMLKYRASDRTIAAATHGRGLFTATLPEIGSAPQTVNFTLSNRVPKGTSTFSTNIRSTNLNIPTTLSSSNPAVAIILTGNKIKIVGAGTTVITAKQSGDSKYKPATPINQTLFIQHAKNIFKNFKRYLKQK